MTKEYKRNHYVPQWYQKCFISGLPPENKLYYLNLRPKNFVDSSGCRHELTSLHRWGPSRCFEEEDLYTENFGDWESTKIEQIFFGEIDGKGKASISFLHNFKHPCANSEAFYNMILYLSIQKLRTPKGLNYLSYLLKNKDKNHVLLKLQELKDLYCAIWCESVWAIADASQSPVKFILSDHPVTVYNMGSKFSETSWCREKEDPEIWLSGTHTLFPLNQNKILILTNHSWVRNPYGDPTKLRPNPKPLRDVMFDFTEVQTGRMLSEIEVTKINYIIKKRAYRYIASTEKEWLYPENHIPTQKWRSLGSEYLLMPDPRSVKFTLGMAAFYSDKSSHIFDAYGRRPGELGYQDNDRDENERKTFRTFRERYARLFGPKYRGITFDSASEDIPKR